MATHDYIIANASGAAVRADLNNALAAIVSNNSNATSPATTYAYQFWADTTANQLKIRNSANDAWITLMELDGTMLMEDGSASTPGLAFASDLNTGFFRSAADKINVATGGTERLEIGSTESVFNDGGADVDFRVEGDAEANLLKVDAGNDRVGIGVASPSGRLHVSSGTSGDCELIIEADTDNNSETDNPRILFRQDGGTDHSAIGNGVNDSTQNNALILANSVSTGGGIIFQTDTGDGYTNATERMRIHSGGQITVGTSSINPGVANSTVGASINAAGYISACRNATVAYFSRTTSDGTLVSFAQGGTGEGTISVSGTTVSYNGAHLSRWSQLAGGADRTEILRGSVLSNLDEMCEWGEEDNEQLNRMKVSDVEGDVNVAGVFQCWDDDDDTYTNDFYCAMTGDFVIRIAQGTTVARGDLLMSAGDGTAKPQDDDIVRSKTVAKVTSTTVSTTYADGSYCVPCVLMAC